ncbi:putative permease [Elusimicrobium minutum Pei191]|uniref:Putative permease n=1 Tax=Elusimicrobium minutum (strain Pei191) TaxID=445932 RepID=B2KD08_ELUMP|nr:permease [Elusimicrobium minutum]ACC98404.1 putative permease [Elusimicrobium minutum Pei191]
METLAIKIVELMGLDPSARLGASVVFFINDSVKIMLMLFVMISAIGVLRTYFNRQRMEKYLGSKNKFISCFFASLFAIFTPFCSCSSVPIFLSLVRMRIPFAASICFLVVSPLVNEYLVALMPSYFGFKIVAVYIIGGITVGMLGGMFLERIGMAKYIEEHIHGGDIEEEVFDSFKARAKFGLNEGKDIVKKLWLWILAGVALGAVIHNYVPDTTVLKVANFGGILSVPLVTLLGAPVYGSCAGVVPIAVVMFSKPIPLGTTIAFLMSVSAMSLPEAVLLRSVMKLKLLGAFFATIIVGIIIMGYFLNFVSPYLIS